MKIYIIFLLTVIFMTNSFSQNQSAKSFRKEITKEVSLNYLLYLPKDFNDKNKFPLVVFLHGSGERGYDIEKVKIHGIPKLISHGKDFNFVAVSPQCPENEEWNLDALNALIDEIISDYKIDENKIYLTGLSMGGAGVWELAIEYPEKFAAIAPVCGVVNRNLPFKVSKLKNMPVWVFHGANDDVVPIHQSANMVNLLKNSGNEKVKFTIYPESGHDSWTTTYENPELYNWFLSQRRVN